MTIEQFCEGIRLDSELSRLVAEFNLEEKIFEKFRALFYKDKEEFIKAIQSRQDEHMFALAVYIRLAMEAYTSYRKRGISDKIYFDTFSDLAIWSRVCKKKYGVPGLTEYDWVALPIELKIFRLGRLQFEPEGKILNVHIPEGEPLDAAECEKSFEEAEKFFGDTYESYLCESWLLTPGLRELLPEESNIIKFQNMFDVFDVVYPFRQAEQRVFGEVLEKKEEYPEDTSLQRALKQYVVSGRDIGIGIGRKMPGFHRF